MKPHRIVTAYPWISIYPTFDGGIILNETRAPARCPRCYYESDGEHCEVTCALPACGPCAHDRFRAANPIEAAREDADHAEAEALHAEESGNPEWRRYAAEAEAAWAHLDDLEGRPDELDVRCSNE